MKKHNLLNIEQFRRLQLQGDRYAIKEFRTRYKAYLFFRRQRDYARANLNLQRLLRLLKRTYRKVR